VAFNLAVRGGTSVRKSNANQCVRPLCYTTFGLISMFNKLPVLGRGPGHVDGLFRLMAKAFEPSPAPHPTSQANGVFTKLQYQVSKVCVCDCTRVCVWG
jgi:hypothetical protein